MTRLQERLTKELPKAKSYRSAMLKAGYSVGTANMGKAAISRLKNICVKSDTEILSQCERRFEELQELARKQNDLGNANRANENITRMHAGFTDRSINDTTIRTQEEEALLAKHRNRLYGLLPKDTPGTL